MTKYLTTAAWAALVLGGVAVADTPPAETAEVASEEAATEVATEAPTEITRTYRYGDAAEAETETESVGTIANVTVEGESEDDAEADGEDTAEEPMLEAEESEEAAPEAE